MKKISLMFTVIVSMALILSACEEGEQKEGKQPNESENDMQNDGVVSKTEEQHEDEEYEKFPTETPSVQKINPDGSNIAFDYIYEEVCWNDCDDDRTYNYPDIHSGDVEVGDRLLIEWGTMEPAPSEVNLIYVDGSGEEISKEPINTDGFTLNIRIGEKEIGKQYAVQFLWKDGENLKGQSVLNFKLN
ncbi:hypothetical protein [Lentibacillus saliphilus]|uniref:hypothetical protein n=1 Tax=Lentibacillus saliphilus TaxID=2737028 RepID=UPI001C3019F3|nr:hypothetical protein [Lentibacillus saliphilus]